LSSGRRYCPAQNINNTAPPQNRASANTRHMTTENLRRCSESETLREIAPAHLLALMEDHRDFIAARGIKLPPPGHAADLNYTSLATLFLSPDDIPPELVEKFHLVKQMSGHDAMDKILDAVKERQLEFTFAPDSSPMDIAAQLLVTNRALFQEIHAERPLPAIAPSPTTWRGRSRRPFSRRPSPPPWRRP
jgi:hypothetical protein